MERKMLDYYPRVIRDYVEFKGIADGQQWLFDGLWNETDRAFANQYVATADEYGLGRWEKMLHIVPKDTDTLEFRRARILNRINQRPPFTIRYLRQQLDSLIGPDKWTINTSYPQYKLVVSSPLQYSGYEAETRLLLGQILPANIAWSIVYLDVEKTEAYVGAHSRAAIRAIANIEMPRQGDAMVYTGVYVRAADTTITNIAV